MFLTTITFYHFILDTCNFPPVPYVSHSPFIPSRSPAILFSFSYIYTHFTVLKPQTFALYRATLRNTVCSYRRHANYRFLSRSSAASEIIKEMTSCVCLILVAGRLSKFFVVEHGNHSVDWGDYPVLWDWRVRLPREWQCCHQQLDSFVDSETKQCSSVCLEVRVKFDSDREFGLTTSQT